VLSCDHSVQKDIRSISCICQRRAHANGELFTREVSALKLAGELILEAGGASCGRLKMLNT